MPDLLAVRAACDISSVAPGKPVEIHAVIDLAAHGERLDRERPPFTVAFVLDTSGSMNGEPVRQVIDSVGRLVDLLGNSDRAGIVAFADNPSVVAPLTQLDGAGRATLKRRVAALAADGCTGMTAGVTSGKTLLPPRTANERQMLILLSDGQPTDGATIDSIEQLARSCRPDVATVALGYGPSHNADLMKGFARGGGGEYWYIPDPSQASVEFARAIGTQGDIVVDGIEVVMAPGDGVEIAEVLGTRMKMTKDGAVVTTPDLRDGQEHTLVVRLVVHAPREVGRHGILDIAVRHRAVGETAIRTVATQLAIAASHQPGIVDVPAMTKVALARAELRRIAARVQADQGRYDAAAAMLRELVRELEAIPGYAKMSGTPLSEAVEQLLDEIMVYEKKPTATQYAEFKMGTALGTDIAQGARLQRAGRIGSGTVGALLDKNIRGHVLVHHPGRQSVRVPLRAEMIIGRSVDNDIALATERASRRHTKLQCKDGKVYVIDLGSTNGTLLNGRLIACAEVVANGDVIKIGDVELIVERDR
jgi:Ca-activated chloride channel homolog